MSETWARRLLILSALWSFVGAISALAAPARHFDLLYNSSLALDQPLESFFYRCTWISVLGWGGTYLLAGLIPASRKSVLIPGGLGKVAFFFACLTLHSSGVGKTAILVAGSVDLALAVVFGVILFRTS